MKHNADKIRRHLTALLDGDVLFDDLSRAMYATDASIYRIPPLGVVAPRHAEDVVRLVRYVAENRVPLTARGGASGLAGQTVGPGIIIDFRRHFRQVLQVNRDECWVRVQPGVFRTELNRALHVYGLQFGPDPSSTDFCTIGGMIANNAAGPHTIRFGATKDHLLSLDLVLADGSLVTADGRPDPEPPLAEPLANVRLGLEGRPRAIGDNWPEVNKNSSGYLLQDAWRDGQLDARRLIAASEGTLALVTEARLNLVPVQPHVVGGLLYFGSRRAAAQAIQPLLRLDPAVLEILDDSLMRVVRDVYPQLGHLLPEGCRAALMVEFEGDEEHARAQLAGAEDLVLRQLDLATGARPATDLDELERLRAVRRAASPLVNRLPGGRQAVVFIEDPAVRPERLTDLVEGLERIFGDHGVEATIVGHAGNGNIHVRPILDLRDPDDVRRAESIADANCDLLKSLRGTLSAEHGDGLCRSPFLPRMFGEAYELFVDVKRAFDPDGILNPGKIIAEPGASITDHLRFGYDYRTVPTGGDMDRPRLVLEAEKCHGCGTCQFYCPMAAEVVGEAATARAKAALLREIIHGHLDADLLKSAEVKQVMDLCLNCKLCLTECPTGVDVPSLALRARAEYVRAHGQTRQNEIIADSQRAGGLGKCLAPLVNLGGRLPPLRWAMERAIGLDRRRRLPAFRRGRFGPRGVPAGTPARGRLVYFAGCFANFNDPRGEGQATVDILERHGYEVIIPELRCCGAALATVGSLDDAIAAARENVAILEPLVADGYEIVASASTCGLMLRIEYPDLVESDAARRVAQQARDIHELLLGLHERGELDTGFGPIRERIAYHSPCHLTAQGLAEAPVRLLELVPGLTVPRIEDHCCGIAGTFGMKTQNFDLSMRIGRHLFEELKRTGADLVVSPCGTCNIQIRQGTGLPVVHTVEILQRAYANAPSPVARTA